MIYSLQNDGLPDAKKVPKVSNLTGEEISFFDFLSLDLINFVLFFGGAIMRLFVFLYLCDGHSEMYLPTYKKDANAKTSDVKATPKRRI